MRSATAPCSQVRLRHRSRFSHLQKEAAADLTPPSSSAFRVPECPSVRELHLELEEVSQLLDASKDQYDEILSVVQRHTDETVNWLSNMAAEFSWLGQTLSNSSTDLDRIFVITKVTRKKRQPSTH